MTGANSSTSTSPGPAQGGGGASDDLASVRVNPLVQEICDNRADRDNPHIKVVLVPGAKFKDWYSREPDVARFVSATDAMIATMQLDEPGSNPPRYTLGIDGERATVFDLDGFPMLAEQIVARLNDTAPAHRAAAPVAAPSKVDYRLAADRLSLGENVVRDAYRAVVAQVGGRSAAPGAVGPADAVAGGISSGIIVFAQDMADCIRKLQKHYPDLLSVELTGASSDDVRLGTARMFLTLLDQVAALADPGAGRADSFDLPGYAEYLGFDVGFARQLADKAPPDRGEGAALPGVQPYPWLLRGVGEDGPGSVSYLDPEGWTDDLSEATGYLLRITADAVAADAKLEGITVDVVHRDVAATDAARLAARGTAPAGDDIGPIVAAMSRETAEVALRELDRRFGLDDQAALAAEDGLWEAGATLLDRLEEFATDGDAVTEGGARALRRELRT